MKLHKLIEGTALTVSGRDDIAITQIVNDSTQVTAGCLFVAIRGVAQDGHAFLAHAVARGAGALVVEDEARVPPGFAGAVIVVDDARDALNQLAAQFFGDPGRSLFCVGVTGTDGKTSVTYMCEAVLAKCGIPTGVIGTVDHHFGPHRWPGDTTPPPLIMQERLAQLLALGARAVALEATSQGLSQSRVTGVPFDVGIFTNLTRDHLDYHRTLEGYFAAKERLFTEALARSLKRERFAIVNVDTSYGPRVRVPSGVTKWTYGRFGSGADLTYETLATELTHSDFRVRGWGKEAALRLPMMGEFNGANALAALAVGVAAGCDFHACVEALHPLAGVPGRVQRIRVPGGRLVFIDYAHDPDAFEKVLTTARQAMSRGRGDARLVTVFGCGGDRDRGKRPLMLQAALRLSDKTIVTADNPRSEDPRSIVDEMFAGIGDSEDCGRVVVELDRAKAIRLALEATGEGDVVMLLGKGHETVQIIGDQRVPHSDYAVVAAEFGITSDASWNDARRVGTHPHGDTDPPEPR